MLEKPEKPQATIEHGEGALIATLDGKLDLSVPKFGEADVVPPNVLFLLGCFLRANEDQDWAQQQMTWFTENGGDKIPGIQVRKKQ